MRPHITDLFICGKESGDWLFGRKNEARFIQLNNAIDARQYAYCPEIRQKMRQSLGIGEDQLVIGHVGRFYPQKNHKFIIDIFQAVRTKNPEAVLLLVGNDAGEGGKEIHQKAEQLGLTPVSYTHLDVYKRQPLGLSICAAPALGRKKWGF